MNILFTCVGRRVALLEAFRGAMAELDVAGRLLGTEVTAACAAFHKVDVGLIVPRVADRQYVPALTNIIRQHRVGLLVPLTDLDLRLLSRHRDEFAEMGCTVMIGSEQAVALCQDKARTNAFLAEAGLAAIKTCMLSEFRSRPFYPCFVKPIAGSSGIGTGMIESAEQLQAHVAAYGEDLIVQEYVPGREFTVDVYRSRTGQVHSIVPRQRLSVRSGEVEKGVTVKDQAVMAAARDLAERLEGIWGVFCCQCRRPQQSADSRPRFFEINPRFAGGAPLAIAAGANLPLYLLQEVLGRPITGKVGDFTDRLLMLRYDEAVFTQVDDVSSLPGCETPKFR